MLLVLKFKIYILKTYYIVKFAEAKAINRHELESCFNYILINK